MRIAVYPGTFDPVTNGHLDIARRAARLFDRIIMAVAPNPEKKPLFTAAERIDLIQANLAEEDRIEVRNFKGLTVDFARAQGAVAIVRGLRAVSDFEFEFQMTQMNRELEPEIETVFLMTTEDYFFTSSAMIKQVWRYTDRAQRFVPANVDHELRARLRREESNGSGVLGA